MQPKYNLRQRTLTQIMNPALKEESPKTFQRQVRNLERLAMKNSSTLREKLKRVIADSQYRIEEKNWNSFLRCVHLFTVFKEARWSTNKYSHQIYLKFEDMICSKKNIPVFHVLNLGIFSIFLYRASLLKFSTV